MVRLGLKSAKWLTFTFNNTIRNLAMASLWLLVQLLVISSKVAANDLVAPAARDKLSTG